jgi:FkbM family methyltransferase
MSGMFFGRKQLKVVYLQKKYQSNNHLMMRKVIAVMFRFLLKIPMLKGTFFGLHQRFFRPYGWFKEVEFTVSIEGVKLHLYIDDWIQENLFFLGEYEKAELKAVESFLPNGGVLIDIGANIGVFSLFLSKRLNHSIEVICFEPYSLNFNSLKRHIEWNHMGRVKAEKIAIGNTIGDMMLYDHSEYKNSGMVTAIKGDGEACELVQIITLDAYLASKEVSQINVIKIDIEGFEYYALQGMAETIRNFQPVLMLELLHHQDTSGKVVLCEHLLKDWGYTKWFIDDDGNCSDKPTNPNRYNFMFLPPNTILEKSLRKGVR